jgi:hypothetical protein
MKSDEMALKGKETLPPIIEDYSNLLRCEKKIGKLNETRGDITTERYEALKDEYTVF